MAILGSGPILDSLTAKTIFGNLPGILELHESIFKDLQKTVDEIALGKQVPLTETIQIQDANFSGAYWRMLRKS